MVPSSIVSIWDMSKFVMIALLSLNCGEILYFGAYKIFVMHLSSIRAVIHTYLNARSVFSDIFCLQRCSVTC